MRKRKSRKLETKKKNTLASDEKDTKSITKRKKRTSTATKASTRKRAQRVRQHLPESPGASANTVSHLIRNATPRRKSKLMNFNVSDNIGKLQIEKLQETLHINKVGRPSREFRNAKKQLQFSSGELWNQNKTVNLYRKRKEHQVKRLSKPYQFRQQCRSKLMDYLEENSRVMPNKKGEFVFAHVITIWNKE